MKILFITMIAFICIMLIILSIAYYAYGLAFKSPKRSDYRNYTLPNHEQYVPHHATIKKYMDILIARPFEDVYITSFDNLKLFGRFYESPANMESAKKVSAKRKSASSPIHLLFHGYKSNPFQDGCGGSGLAAELGHRFIVVDQRSHGQSEGNTITFGIKERRDVLSWINYCKERFGEDIPIILWGLSMGAATVLMASDLDLPKNVKGIIADCPFSSPVEIIKKVGKDMHFPPNLLYPFVKLGAKLYGRFDLEECSALSAIENAKLPILLFHGEDDHFVPWDMSRNLSEARPDIITFVSVPGAGHGLCYMVSGVHYRHCVIKYLETVLN